MADEWRVDFLAFYNYVGTRPGRAYSLDRIDVNGDYAPGNVRWATARQQSENKRSSIYVETPSGKVTLKELARRFGINYQSLHFAVKRGRDPIEAAKRLAAKHSHADGIKCHRCPCA